MSPFGSVRRKRGSFSPSVSPNYANSEFMSDEGRIKIMGH
jgi:hypothetical protein